MYYPGTPQKDVALVEAEINKNGAKIGATLKINAIDWGQWDNKLNLMISSGEKSDIIFTAAWQNYTVNVAKGAFLPLNDLLDQYGQDIKKSGPCFPGRFPGGWCKLWRSDKQGIGSYTWCSGAPGSRG